MVAFHYSIVLFNIVNVLDVFGKAPTGGWRLLLLVALEYVPIYTLAPRFILSIREMYARDTRGRREGVDTGFGLGSSGRDATVQTMVFAAAAAGRNGEDDIEEIPRENVTSQVV